MPLLDLRGGTVRLDHLDFGRNLFLRRRDISGTGPRLSVSGGLELEDTGLTITAGGVTVTAGGLTVTAGGLTVTDGDVTLGQAVSQIVPGATSLSFRNNADGADNLIITDAGVATVRAGLVVTAGGFALQAGRVSEELTVVDDDTQNMTLAAADVTAGINVHTSVTGAGTITTDTAANLVSELFTAVNQTVVSYFINDGSQTDTFSAGSGVTIADAGQTVAANESAILIWRATNVTASSEAVTLYIIGA